MLGMLRRGERVAHGKQIGKHFRNGHIPPKMQRQKERRARNDQHGIAKFGMLQAEFPPDKIHKEKRLKHIDPISKAIHSMAFASLVKRAYRVGNAVRKMRSGRNKDVAGKCDGAFCQDLMCPGSKTEPAIPLNMTVMIVNLKSAHEELAVKYLEYMADHLPQKLRVALMPDMSEPIENSYDQRPAASSMQQFIDGSRNAKRFIREFERITDMMQMKQGL